MLHFAVRVQPNPRLVLLIGLIMAALAVTACAGQAEANWIFPEQAQEPPAQPPSAQSTPVTMPTVAILATPVPSASITPVRPPGDNLILAHYMAWFRTRPFSGYWQHWQWDPDGDGQEDPGDSLPDRVGDDGLRQIAAVDYPLIGPYDSGDAAAIEYQVTSAWAAGIDGFVVDWYGPQDGGNIDRAFAQTLATVSRWQQQHGLRFFVGINYEEKILSGLAPAQRETALHDHLSYILTGYATAPAFLTYQGLPVIFYFQAWQDELPGLLSPEALERARQDLPPHYLLYMGAEANFLDVVDGFFTWISGANDDPQDWGATYVNWVYSEMDYRTLEHDLVMTVGSVWPSFDDSGVGGWGDTLRVIDDQDGDVYTKTWERALNAKAQRTADTPSWVQIVTWNDWNEGTQIEPTLADGTALLAATQEHARAYTGRDMPRAAIDVPARIWTLRHEQPGPDTEARVQQIYTHFFAAEMDLAISLLAE